MKVVRVPRQADGNASALVVHGNDLCGEFYAPLAARLAARGIDVSLVTLAGFHREPPYDEPSWQRYAGDIADAVRDLDGARSVLIGHSMGGLMALLAAAALGDALDRLVLVEPAIYPRRFMAKAGSKAYLSKVVHGDRNVFVNSTGVVPRVHDLARFPADMIELYKEVRRTSHLPTMTALFRTLPAQYPLPFSAATAPTLLVSGGNVGVRGQLLAVMVRRRLRGRVTHRIVPDAAHWIVNERDDLLGDYIAEFCA